MQFSPVILHFLSLFPNIVLSILTWIKVFNTLSLCFYINVRDQISHQYKTTTKIVVLCRLVFKSLETRWEDIRH